MVWVWGQGWGVTRPFLLCVSVSSEAAPATWANLPRNLLTSSRRAPATFQVPAGAWRMVRTCLASKLRLLSFLLMQMSFLLLS